MAGRKSRGRGKPLARQWSLAPLVAAGSIAVVTVALVLGWLFALLVAEDWRNLTSTELYDIVRSDVAATALLGAGAAALIAYRRQRTTEAEHELAQGMDLRDRYTSAAEHLGHDKAAVRLAGVYAMAQLADQWGRRGNAAERQVYIDVLCAYLRMPSDDDIGGWNVDEEAQVRATVLRVLRQHLRSSDDPASWCDADIDLTGAVLRDVDFRRVTFAGAVSFERAEFRGRGPRFDDARFTGRRSRFVGAVFEETAQFPGAQFRLDRADFAGAVFNAGADFAGADFSDCWAIFDGSSFGGEVAHFREATFSDGLGVSFAGARFFAEHTLFRGSAMGRAVFHQARFEGPVDFGGAVFTGSKTTFDEAAFTGGHASFEETRFTSPYTSFVNCLVGTTVGFDGAHFAGREVDLHGLSLARDRTVDLSGATWTARLSSPPPAGVAVPAQALPANSA